MASGSAIPQPITKIACDYRPGGGGGATGCGPAGAGPGTTTPPGTGAVIITSASALVGNGPLTITAWSAGLDSTITVLPELSFITQYSAANVTEQRANKTAHTRIIRLNFITCLSLPDNSPDFINPGSKLVSARGMAERALLLLKPQLLPSWTWEWLYQMTPPRIWVSNGPASSTSIHRHRRRSESAQ